MSDDHIIIRVDRSLKQLVIRVAKARGEVPTDFVRRAVKLELARLSYLSPDEKKALGIPSIEPRESGIRPDFEQKFGPRKKSAK